MNRIVYAILFGGAALAAPLWALLGMAVVGDVHSVCLWMLCLHSIVAGLALAGAVVGKTGGIVAVTIDGGGLSPLRDLTAFRSGSAP